MRIAIVGTGIAGNACAYALTDRHQVTVYEKELRPGGHSHTVDVDYDGRRIAVDTGFIVYNDLNYPNLTALFAHLGVETIESDMSFSVSADHGRFEWAGRAGSLPQVLDAAFAQRRNLLRPSFWRMLRDMQRFNRQSIADKAAGRLAGLTLGDYLRRERFSRELIEDYLIPMGSAIWSMSVERMMLFPAENFVAFFDNHKLLHWDRPVWRTVKEGSRSYVEKILAPLKDRIRLGAAVVAIERHPTGVKVTDSHGRTDLFDQVVIAAHSDQALAMLTDASDDERRVLGDVGYAPNDVYLHRDPALMPVRKRAWAAWNFLRDDGQTTPGGAVSVTYWMNALQKLPAECPLFISLNPPVAPDPNLVFARFRYDHPQFTAEAFAAQKRLDDIQGVRRTWFCGAWAGYGFHEDGLVAGLNVAERLGAALPWRDVKPALAQAAE